MTTDFTSRALPRTETEVEETVNRLAVKANVPTDSVSAFAKISDPQNKQLISAKVARKAFAHVKARL
jgi:hypothetical protein